MAKKQSAIVDQYLKNLEELFLLRNPKHRFNKNYKMQFGSFVAEIRGDSRIVK